jgi:hypothetical protein
MLKSRGSILKTVLVFAVTLTCFAQTAAPTLPGQISDKEFWQMIVDLSEPGGTYPYENFVSNELQYQDVVPALKATTKPGGVYIGVGPEQNFTYAEVLQSKLAFVIDIRRQNMVELLMYKALFEMSPSRADFVSNLFSRVRPAGLDTKTNATALCAAYEKARVDSNLYAKNLQTIKAYMTKHGYALTGEDVSKCPTPDPIFVSALAHDPGNAFRSLLALDAVHKASGTVEPGPLDSISPNSYVTWWRNNGARIGVMDQTGTTILWEN